MRLRHTVGRSDFARTRSRLPTLAQLLRSAAIADYTAHGDASRMKSRCRPRRLQQLERSGDQRVGPVLNISSAVQQLNIGGYAFAFVTHHVGREVLLI